MTLVIGELVRDAVTEMINIAIGRAAASLSALVGDELRLSVPHLDFLTPAEAAAQLDRETGGADTVAVRQHFDGRLAGDILLIFPERRSLALVRSILGAQVPLDQLTELEQEALLEVGNIILNACLGSLANQLGLALESSLPVYLRGRGNRILEAGATRPVEAGEMVLFVHVDFAMLKNDINGYVAFLMDIPAAQHFLETVRTHMTVHLAG